PIFLLGRELFDRSVGFWAAVLFQTLPATGRFLSDGLSEATFLLFAAFTIWLGARSLRTRSAVGFALAGVCGGLCFLVGAGGGLGLGKGGFGVVGEQGGCGVR